MRSKEERNRRKTKTKTTKPSRGQREENREEKMKEINYKFIQLNLLREKEKRENGFELQ